MKFSAFDLETTGTDVSKTGVVQAAVVSAPLAVVDSRPGCAWVGCNKCITDTHHDPIGGGAGAMTCLVCGKLSAGQSAAASERPTVEQVQLPEAVKHSMLFHVEEIPAAATRVHGITTEDVKDCKPFARCVRSVVKSLTAPDVIAVSYNGCGFDIPVIARYLLAGEVARWKAKHEGKTGAPPKPTQDAIEQRIRARHIDVMRLWHRMQSERPLAKCYAGTLAGAHLHLVGEMFDGAHDASVDCTATLATLDVMLRTGYVTVSQAIKWSNSPMPGDVDYQGKLKWDGDQVLLGFGPHKGEPLESHGEVPGFLRWMLGKDFATDTKQLIKDFLAGQYPVREYENET